MSGTKSAVVEPTTLPLESVDDPNPTPDDDGFVFDTASVGNLEELGPGDQPEPDEREVEPVVVTATPETPSSVGAFPEGVESKSAVAVDVEAESASESQPPVEVVADTDADAPPDPDPERHLSPSKQRKADAHWGKLTKARYDAEGREAVAQARVQALEAELAAQAKASIAAAPEQATVAAEESPAPPSRPVHPEWGDFDTEDDYKTATAKWDTDMAQWQAAQTKADEARVEHGIDERFAQRDQARAATEHQRALHSHVATALEQAKQAHPGWNPTDAQAEMAEVRSPFVDEKDPNPTPFLHDVALHSRDTGELLHYFATELDDFRSLADLLPTRELRDAVITSSAPLLVMKHFATDDGRQDFDRLKGLPQPAEMLGVLIARLEDAESRGSSPVVRHSSTSVRPPAKPPAGAPRARPAAAPDPSKEPWDQMVARENEEENERIRQAYRA